MPTARQKSLPRPPGRTAMRPPYVATVPATRPTIPSPPMATTTRSSAQAAAASSSAWASDVVGVTTRSWPAERRAASTDGSSLVARPPPADGLTTSWRRRATELLRDQLAGVEDPGRVEQGLHRPQHLDAESSDLVGHPGAVVGADGVVVRDRRTAGDEGVTRGCLGLLPLGNRVLRLSREDGEVERRALPVEVRDVAHHDR